MIQNKIINNTTQFTHKCIKCIVCTKVMYGYWLYGDNEMTVIHLYQSHQVGYIGSIKYNRIDRFIATDKSG